ncbi:dipeptide ABC transporter permease and ATP-binding protein [Modestobacter italicus]|uniref:Dipeptide ABC transporter permease and ATP-binding protein n=1 Tax=Modestobacter italicus (strain DSM 44449 / CECT 9708 / BC 501) TaxID=2732864 RepID=I4EYD3_MODI5|nr:dipeptide/oligopeptide/nickel ABC transporter permease/ATP-binding protein [Modestobacter marinus]CCH88396.1 dipeptide ABC transporter permease and ATP-binding protein [Modestobacter marinus]
MTATLPPAQVVPVATLERAARVSLSRRLLHNPTGVLALTWLVLVVLAAVLAPLLAPHDPNTASANDVLATPGGSFPLGADASGHDILSRLLYASRLSLAGAATTVVVAAVLGISAGLIAGYYGRVFESVASWSASLIMSLNAIVVLLAARTVTGPSVFTAMAIFGVLIAPAFYRVVSAAVSGVRHELYVDAARVSGLSDGRIIAKHVLTVVRAPAIILAAGIAGIAIAIQAGLDFLGLGDPSRPTWGGMLNAAFSVIFRAPLQLLWPSLAIGLTCVALVLLGNALRDELERSAAPKVSRRARRNPAAVSVTGEPVVVHEEPAGPRGEVLLDVRGLSVGYDQPDGTVTTVVRDVSLTVRRGEVHGLIGESGSGKTQTAWSILRLLPAGGRIVGGVIEFEGADLASASAKEMTALRGARIAYVPQEPMSNLDPAFTIGHQLTEPLRLKLGISRAEARERALGLLERVGIPDPRRTYAAYPHQISGGMAQRVLIAGAVSCNPDLLIADEPTTALDVTVQAEVLDLLRDLQSEFDMGVLLVTHNFGVVADLCDRVSVMRDGRIVETGPARSLFAGSRHGYTRALFEAVLEDGEPRGPLTPAAAPQGAPS